MQLTPLQFHSASRWEDKPVYLFVCIKKMVGPTVLLSRRRQFSKRCQQQDDKTTQTSVLFTLIEDGNEHHMLWWCARHTFCGSTDHGRLTANSPHHSGNWQTTKTMLPISYNRASFIIFRVLSQPPRVPMVSQVNFDCWFVENNGLAFGRDLSSMGIRRSRIHQSGVQNFWY